MDTSMKAHKKSKKQKHRSHQNTMKKENLLDIRKCLALCNVKIPVLESFSSTHQTILLETTLRLFSSLKTSQKKKFLSALTEFARNLTARPSRCSTKQRTLSLRRGSRRL